MLRTTEQVAPESIRSRPISPDQISRDPPVHNRHPVLQQHWGELAYFHWPYEPEVVQCCLPKGVTVDTFDGAAWVGLIPFEMRKVQLGPTPPLPWLGSFIEINVRTYVTDALGRRAVWFTALAVFPGRRCAGRLVPEGGGGGANMTALSATSNVTA